MAGDIGTLVQKQLPQVVKVLPISSPNGWVALLGSATVIAGAVVGGVSGRLAAPKASLNVIKEELGVSGSELNFKQIDKVANINSGFLSRKVSATHRTDAERIQNLKQVVENTEHALSSDAHKISKAVGQEDRYFDYEGAKLVNTSSSSAQLDAVKNLESALLKEVKKTEKHTLEHGNALATVGLRDYLRSRILDAAYARGFAENYIKAAVQEREEMRQTDPKLAEIQFAQALQNGIETGILAPQVDGKCYEGMVKATAIAAQNASKGNPDSSISSLFDSYQKAGLISSDLRAQFTQDVRKQLPDNLEASVSALKSQSNGFWNRLFHVKEKAQVDQQEDGLSKPPSSAIEKERIAEKNQEIANLEVNEYTGELRKLQSSFKEIIELYSKYIPLKKKKLALLNVVMGMKQDSLRGAAIMAHKEGVDLFKEYETNDQSLRNLFDQIASLDESTPRNYQAFPHHPKNFSSASKEQQASARLAKKEAVQAFEELKKYNRDAKEINKNVEDLESILGKDAWKANKILFPATEEPLTDPKQKVNVFTKIFGNKKQQVEGKEGEPDQLEAEMEPIPSAPAIENQEEDNLPEPIIVPQKPSWKLWV